MSSAECDLANTAWRAFGASFNISTSQCCNSQGIFCDANTSAIRAIFWAGNSDDSTTNYGIVGSGTRDIQGIAALSGLKSLQKLSLYNIGFGNQQMPLLQYGFKSLTSLSLMKCQLGHQALQSITALTNLTQLHLSNNQFSGPLLDWFASWPQLANLSLANNQWEGPLPLTLYGLTRLTTLDLSNNNLNATLEPLVGQLTQLKSIHLASNQLSGPLPMELFSLTTLSTLDLSHNLLSGSLDESISKLVNLETLHLDGNKFEGALPATLSKLDRLISCTVDNTFSCWTEPLTTDNVCLRSVSTVAPPCNSPISDGFHVGADTTTTSINVTALGLIGIILVFAMTTLAASLIIASHLAMRHRKSARRTSASWFTGYNDDDDDDDNAEEEDAVSVEEYQMKDFKKDAADSAIDDDGSGTEFSTAAAASSSSVLAQHQHQQRLPTPPPRTRSRQPHSVKVPWSPPRSPLVPQQQQEQVHQTTPVESTAEHCMSSTPPPQRPRQTNSIKILWSEPQAPQQQLPVPQPREAYPTALAEDAAEHRVSNTPTLIELTPTHGTTSLAKYQRGPQIQYLD